jgi:hypothetical protein
MHFPTTAFRAAFCATLAFVVLLFAAPDARAATTGEQKTAVILVNFTDKAPPKTVAEASSLVFGGVSDFLWENSYHHTFLGGDTFGWFTIPLSSVGCDMPTLVSEGNKAATAAGADLAAYAQVIYMFPLNSCGWAGLGEITSTGQKHVFINGAFDVRVVSHEIGHGFMLDHSDGLDCDTSPIGGNCTQLDRGSPADTIGGGRGQFNVFQKEKLGWLNASGMPVITTVATSGRYTLEPLETQTSGVKGLKVLKSTNPTTGQKTWYYLEYRQALGFDAGLAGMGNLTSGVMVMTGTASSTSSTNMLLDMTPNSYNLSRNSDFEDGALGAGKVFTDSTAGVTISVVSADASGAVVDIGIATTPVPTCTRAAPVMSLSGPGGSVAAGSTINYTIGLSNRDSSACAATTFSLARSLPSGWTGALAAGSLSLSPGTSGSTTLSVTSPTTAVASSYGVGAGASSPVGSTHTANASATYTVAAASTSITDSVATDKSSYLRGETVSMSARVLADGQPIGGASVRFTIILPSGSSSVLTATSGGDGYARSTFKLGKTKAVAGTYQLRADATAAGGNASASTAFSAR